ncbi:MAG: transcription termination/antitermination NusG family protein [Candidatus Bipolaricaulia bacterium]
MKRWYVIQTYAGSELKVKEELEKRVAELDLEKQKRIEGFATDGDWSHFIVPIEEVITSQSRKGRAGQYRIPYDYELKVKPNQRIERGTLIAVKPVKRMDFDAVARNLETFQRVIVEMTNKNEEEYLIPREKKIRRDIKTGGKIRRGVPLTQDQDERFIVDTKGKIVLRDRAKRIEFERDDGSVEMMTVPESYLVRVRNGMKFHKGDLLEEEDRIYSKVSGMVKIKEYKEKRLITVQRIEKRRIFPGYIFCKVEMDDEIANLVDGIRSTWFVGRDRPLPLDEEDMKVVQRKAGLIEVPTAPEGPKIEVDFEVGEVVEIIDGPFADFTGEIKSIDKDAEEVTVMVKIFGRETPVTLGFEGIEKI